MMGKRGDSTQSSDSDAADKLDASGIVFPEPNRLNGTQNTLILSSTSSAIIPEKRPNEIEIEEESNQDLKVEMQAQSEEVVEAKASQDENLNVRAAIVHMVGDMIQSLGVIIAAVIIYFKPEWTIADPICTFLFSILVMFTTVPIFKDCMSFLMEAAPESEDYSTNEVYNSIMDLEEVKEIHDFHLWSLSDEKPIFTAHVVADGNVTSVLQRITELLQKQFKIYHTTVQVEPVNRNRKDNNSKALQSCICEHHLQEQPLSA